MKTTADVVVIGGGVIGCAIAAELAQRGVGVTLLERDRIASGASGRNHGLLWYPQNSTTDPLYRASLEVYREIASRSEVTIGLDDSPVGVIVVVRRPEEWPLAEAEAKLAEAGGVSTRRLEGEALRAEEPNLSEETLGGCLIEDGYRLDPAALTLALALEARREGAEVITHLEAKQVLVRDGRVTGVATDQGVLASPTVVDAAGPWASRVARSAGVDIPVRGARGWLLLTNSIPPIARHLVAEAGWHLDPDEVGPPVVTVEGYGQDHVPEGTRVGLLVQQNLSGHVLLGGSRLASLTEDPEGPEVPREIARKAVAMVPSLAGVSLAGVWSGVRPMSPDGIPLIGWVPGVEGLFAATGHGGQGVILGAGTGRLAAAQILGGQTFMDPSPFDPFRFVAR